MLRSAARFAFDIGRVVVAELLERGSEWTLARLNVEPPPAAPTEECDSLEEVTDQQLAAFMIERTSMIAPARKSRPQQEESPPNEPPVGSFEWRSRQARSTRPG